MIRRIVAEGRGADEDLTLRRLTIQGQRILSEERRNFHTRARRHGVPSRKSLIFF
jgi:hypothetical protein